MRRFWSCRAPGYGEGGRGEDRERGQSMVLHHASMFASVEPKDQAQITTVR
ncbi:hypothetical protein CZ674_04410 [Agrococcus casei LMG 22410]|uniref:Uncharacterized protein n=1 Tax=Agrococcus casei LMG 22410 TaxID=1255656 RepID=A0A1R4FGB6_9MICO|nr:hypothetical protein CZ674_04410 [Agrococcus casei LMG 22410]